MQGGYRATLQGPGMEDLQAGQYGVKSHFELNGSLHKSFWMKSFESVEITSCNQLNQQTELTERFCFLDLRSKTNLTFFQKRLVPLAPPKPGVTDLDGATAPPLRPEDNSSAFDIDPRPSARSQACPVWMDSGLAHLIR